MRFIHFLGKSSSCTAKNSPKRIEIRIRHRFLAVGDNLLIMHKVLDADARYFSWGYPQFAFEVHNEECAANGDCYAEVIAAFEYDFC